MPKLQPTIKFIVKSAMKQPSTSNTTPYSFMLPPLLQTAHRQQTCCRYSYSWKPAVLHYRRLLIDTHKRQ